VSLSVHCKRASYARRLIETVGPRIWQTLSSAHSAAIVWHDGTDPRCLTARERQQYLLLRPALNFGSGLVVYDIGANEGHFAAFTAKLKSVSTVYCFEPVAGTFAKLAERLTSCRKVRCYPLGLSDQSGAQMIRLNRFSPSTSLLPMGQLHRDEFPFTMETREERVQITTLREVAQTHTLLPPDFIKIDVQGVEDRVIRGGVEIVRQARFCMVELSLTSLFEGSPLITDLNTLMRQLGFRLVGIVGEIVGRSGEILQVDGLYKNTART
jgi:FkbM family methyltransferase